MYIYIYMDVYFLIEFKMCMHKMLVVHMVVFKGNNVHSEAYIWLTLTKPQC